MSGQWKPGDVASFLIRDKRVNAIRTSEGRWTAYAPGVDQSWLDRPWDGMHGHRPLVVIDPEDREQIERLTKALVETLYTAGQHSLATQGMHPDQTQAALREFANPATPKPEEPTGLGAVVEDADGKVYVRGYWPDAAHTHPWHVIDPAANMCMSWWKYDDIKVAVVLSEGVTP